MKLITDLLEKDRLLLELRSTNNELVEFNLSKKNIHYWYPFNINYFYKYSDSRKYLYLAKDRNYEGPSVYSVDIVKRTQPLPELHGAMYNQTVFTRNMQIMFKAQGMGVKTIAEEYDNVDVDEGFEIVGAALDTIKEGIENRYIETDEEPLTFQIIPTEEYDELIFKHTNEDEKEELIKLGEIYSMLVLMRKILEGS